MRRQFDQKGVKKINVKTNGMLSNQWTCFSPANEGSVLSRGISGIADKGWDCYASVVTTWVTVDVSKYCIGWGSSGLHQAQVSDGRSAISLVSAKILRGKCRYEREKLRWIHVTSLHSNLDEKKETRFTSDSYLKCFVLLWQGDVTPYVGLKGIWDTTAQGLFYLTTKTHQYI